MAKKRLSVDQDLAVRAFEQGFAVGADPAHSRRRTVVEPATHISWRRGMEAGQAAARRASAAFAAGLLRCVCGHMQTDHATMAGFPGGDNVGPCLNVSGDLADSSGISACSCKRFKSGVQTGTR